MFAFTTGTHWNAKRNPIHLTQWLQITPNAETGDQTGSSPASCTENLSLNNFTILNLTILSELIEKIFKKNHVNYFLPK